MMKDFVATRPRRPRSGRVIAGVAAGIGRRYAIDPVIVRVALVVSAFYGGAGVLAYLLGWLFLAAEEDQVSPFEALIGRGHSSLSKGLTIVLCAALIPATEFVIGGHISTIAGAVVLLGGLYLLHKYRAPLGQVDQQAPTEHTAGGTAMNDSTPSGTGTGPVEDAVPTERTEPPAWDPLGAAPFAWDLPDPTPTPPEAPQAPGPRPPRRRGRSRIGLATVGLVLVTGATLAAVSNRPDTWLDAGHIAGILAAIAAIGLIVGAFTHSGRGLVALAIVLGIASFGLTETHFNGWHGAGDQTYQPTRLTDVHDVYQQSVGNLRLNLTQLPPSGTVRTKLQLGAGNLDVIVPRDAAVQVTCSASVGDVQCLGQHETGPGNPTITASQPASHGNQLTIILDAQDGPGQVRVTNNG
jgi:phage shock protein PspC (stress-responsive transcriptional regulator)